jgi:hypothetical protein
MPAAGLSLMVTRPETEPPVFAAGCLAGNWAKIDSAWTKIDPAKQRSTSTVGSAL